MLGNEKVPSIGIKIYVLITFYIVKLRSFLKPFFRTNFIVWCSQLEKTCIGSVEAAQNLLNGLLWGILGVNQDIRKTAERKAMIWPGIKHQYFVLQANLLKYDFKNIGPSLWLQNFYYDYKLLFNPPINVLR